MSWHDPDMPDFNPEPPDEHFDRTQGEACPDCKTGTIMVPFGCDTCGLSWEDLLAAETTLREATAD